MTWMLTDLAALNLNQLVALEAPLTECNVRRAATRMGVTQSAMSHTLRGLRELLGDPLLVRVGNTMVPTPHAEQITGSLRRGLTELESVVRGRAAFDPGQVRDEFTLACHDGIAGSFTAPLYRGLRAHAPHARLRIAPFDAQALGEQMLVGDVDTAIVPTELEFDGLVYEPGASTAHVAVMSKRHPRVRKRLSLAAYCETPHAMVTITGQGPGLVDQLLAPLGRTRTVAVRVPYLYALPELLASSVLIATLPIPVAAILCARWPLKALPLPVSNPRLPVLLCWHERTAADPAAQFFRERVREASAEAAASLPH